MDISQLGSLFFDGSPVPIGALYNGEQINFGDAVPGMGIPFIKWGNAYIADRCVCFNVSWRDLDNQGFIFGRPVTINGSVYLCRSIKEGRGSRTDDEWSSLLDAFGEENRHWHWKNCFFWGQDTYTGDELTHIVLGYTSARFRGGFPVEERDEKIGFRPILEPLPPEMPVSDDLIGSVIKVCGDGGVVVGRLVGYSDYDLELKHESTLPENCPWLKQTKDAVFVDREAITYLWQEG